MKLKLTALALCAVMLLSVFAGCARNGDAVQPAVAERVANVFRADFVAIPKNYNISSNDAFVSGDRIYILCYEILDEETYESRNVLYSMDLNGENPETKVLTEPGENTSVSNIFVKDDGTWLYVENTYDSETYESKYVLRAVSADGTTLFEIDPESLFPETDDSNMYGSFYPRGLQSDAEGNIYLSSENTVAVLDSSGAKLFEVTVPNWIEAMGTVGGRVYLRYYDYENGGNLCKYIDLAAKSLGESFTFPENFTSYDVEMYMGEGHEMYLKNTTGLYGYSTGDTAPVEIINWINSDINPNNISSLTILSPEKLIYSGYNSLTSQTELAFLARIPDEEVTPKFLITLATTQNSYEVLDYIVNFNRANEKYRIVLNDYSRYQTEEDWERGATMLNADIAAGKIPDILMIPSYSDMPVESYEKMGLFADLYEYFDSDADVSRDMLLKAVRTPFERDGKLYRLVTGFSVQTLAAKKSIVGDRTSWTVAEMLELANSLDEGVQLYEDMTKSSMLNMICQLGLYEFINYETMQCSFDGQTFVDLLNYVNTFPAEIDWANYNLNQEDRYAKYREGQVVLSSSYLSQVSDYIRTRDLEFGEDISYIGYPGVPGNGSIVQANTGYAISAKSAQETRDGAWTFLKMLISDDLQKNGRYNFSATETAFDAMVEEEKAYHWFYSYDGSGWGSDEPFTEEDLAGQTGVEVKITDEDVAYVKAFLDSLTTTAGENTQILSIITEECEAFFAGTKSAEETAKIIQSRVSIYISESN